MQKRTGITLLALSLSLSLGFSQSTVNYGAGLGQPDVYSGSTLLPDGNQVRIGFFNPGFDVSANLFDLDAMGVAWNNYGDTLIRDLLGEHGRFSATSYSPDSTGLFDDQQIWVWIFKTTDNAIPTADYGNVTDYGLFSSTEANWLFPPSSAMLGLDTTSIYSSEVNQALFGSYSVDHLFLSPVPEPNAGMLLLVGVGLLLTTFWVRSKSNPSLPLSRLRPDSKQRF